MTTHTSSALVISAQLARELAATAAAYAESLAAEQCGHALLPFGSDERYDWHYVPRQRPGLPLRDMEGMQRAAAMALLHKGLSQAGGRKALAIIARENILKRDEPSEPYDPLDYAFAVYGDPRGASPWAWSVEGHHLSLNFTLVRETEITVTPLFMGVAPLLSDDEGAADPVLLRERDLALDIVRALDGREREQAIIADRSMATSSPVPVARRACVRPSVCRLEA